MVIDMAEIKNKQYVPLSSVMKQRNVDFTKEKVYVRGWLFAGGAYIDSIDQYSFESETYARIKYIRSGRESRVLLSQLLILETVEENKTEENIMLFKGCKIAVVVPTDHIIRDMPNEPNRAVLGSAGIEPFSEPRIARYHGNSCIDTACYCEAKVGDFVAVISNDKVMTARVVNIIENTTVNGINIKGEVLDVIDTTAYADRSQKAVEAENLKRQMDAEVEQMKEQAAYDSFAEKNPFLAQMLSRYKTLMGDDTKTDNKNDAE